MVQIIERSPGFAEGLVGGLGPGLAKGIGSFVEQRVAKKAIADKMAMFEKPEFKDFFANVDPRIAQIMKFAAAGAIEPGVATSLTEMVRQSQSDIDFANALPSDSPVAVPDFENPQASTSKPSTEEIPSPNPAQSNKQKPSAPKRDYETEIENWQKTLQFADTPKKLAFAQSRIKELQSQRDYELKNKINVGEMEYKEAKPTIEYANNLALELPDEKQNLDAMDLALSSKDFGFFSKDNIAEMTGFEKFRSPEGALLKSAIKEYFLGDVKGVGGKGLNQWLEKQLNDAMLKIGRDNEANEVVKSGFKARYDRKKAWLDEYRKLYKEQKKDQGYVSGDISQQVAENLEPYFNARQKQLEAEIKAVKKSGQGLSGKMIEVIDDKGETWEIDESQVGELPEGFRLK